MCTAACSRSRFPVLALAALLSACGTFDSTSMGFPAPPISAENAVDHDPAKVVDTSLYRTSRPHSRAVQMQVSGVTSNSLRHLVDALVSGIPDPFEKVKILHDWIALNVAYDAKAYYSGVFPDQSSASVFRRKTAVCDGYSNLFLTMCGMADIPCRKLTGHARGYGFCVAAEEDVKEVLHAWSAVRIGDTWYLLDVTWDSGYATPPANYTKDYSTGYLFLQPENMIFTHFPISPEWQLLDPPVTGEQFVRLPFIRGEYFRWFEKPVEKIEKIHHVKGDFTLNIPTPQRTAIQASLWTEADIKTGSSKYISGSYLVQREGGNTVIRLAFPKKDNYYLEISARRTKSIGPVTPDFATFYFVVEEPSAIQYANWGFWDWMQNADNRLISPMIVPLQIGTRVLFQVELPGMKSAFLEKRCPHEDGVLVSFYAYLDLLPGSNGIFKSEITIPDTCALGLVASEKELQESTDRGKTMLEFPVTEKTRK